MVFDAPQPQPQPTDRATPWRVFDAPQPPQQPQPQPTDRATLRRVVGRLVAAAVVVVGLGMFVAWVMLRSGFGVWTTFSVSAWLTVFGALIYTILRMRRDPAMVPAVRTFLVGAFVTTGLVVGSSVIESESAGQPEQWTAAAPGTTAVDSLSGAAIDSGDADPRVVHDEPSRERPERERPERVDRTGAVDASVVSEPDELGAEPAETIADEQMSGPDDGDVSSLPVVGNNAPGAPGDDRRRVSTTVPDPAIPPAPGTSSPAPAPTIPPATTTTATSPPTTQPATTQPATTTTATSPPTTQPATTQAATTQPATSPPTTQPATTQPATTQPVATQPVATQPATTQPATTQPVATEPATTQPVATEPVATEPVATEPVATEPTTTEPVATEPTTTEPTTQPAPNLPPQVPPHVGPKSGTSEGSD